MVAGSPRATRRILLCMDRIPDMSFFFRRQEKSVLFFEMDPAVAGSLQRAIIAGGWGNRQRLAVRLVCAFCCGAGVTLNNLSMELASEEVFRRPEGYLIHTYVSNYQVRVPEGDGRRPAHERGGYADGRRRTAGGDG